MYAGQIVEIGMAEEIFHDAWHPYTWALLSALPQLGVKGEKLPTIDGTPPNLFNKIVGDAFAPRNRHALNIISRKGFSRKYMEKIIWEYQLFTIHEEEFESAIDFNHTEKGNHLQNDLKTPEKNEEAKNAHNQLKNRKDSKKTESARVEKNRIEKNRRKERRRCCPKERRQRRHHSLPELEEASGWLVEKSTVP